MTEIIQFSDNDLKNAIINYWNNQDVQILDDTALSMVEEVKSKMKNNTIDELKLALSELKFSLEPDAEATINIGNFVVASLSFINDLTVLSQRTHSQPMNFYEKMESLESEKNKVKELVSNFENQPVSQLRGKLQDTKDKLVKRLKRIQEEKKRISSFDQEKVNSLVNDKELQKAAEIDHKRFAGLSDKEQDVFERGIEKIKKEKINPEEKQKEIEEAQWASKKLDDTFGTIGNAYYLIPNVKGDKYNTSYAWSAERIYFEALSGRGLQNETSKKKINAYFRYIMSLNQYENMLYSLINEISIFLTNSKSREKQLNSILNTHTNNSHKVLGEIFENVKKIIVTISNESIEFAKKLEDSYSKLQTQIDQATAQAEQGFDKTGLNPDNIALFMGKIKRDFLSEKKRGTAPDADLPQGKEFWQTNNNLISELNSGSDLKTVLKSYIEEIKKSIDEKNGENKKLAIKRYEDVIDSLKFISGMSETWQKGRTIYDTIDPAGEKMQRKINNIMQNNPSGYVAKIDQRFTQSPQLSEKEQLELELNFKQLTNLSTMSEDTKLDLAKNPHTHWALLFSLAIYKKTKQRIDEETSTEKHTQHEANINSKEVRAMVVENKNTPNWILMFIAEHDPEVGKLAEKKLFERGYSITIKGGKVIVDTENGTGAWVWTKHKKSKASVENNFIVTAQTSQVQNLLQQIKQINTQIESLQKQQENLNRQKEQLGQQVDNARQRAAQEPNPNEFKDTTNYGQPKLSNIYKNLFRIIIGEQSQLEIGKEEEISEHADTFNEIKKNVEETGNVGMSVDEFGEEIAKVHLKEDPNYYKESSLKFSKRK